MAACKYEGGPLKPNTPPVANAGADQTVLVGSTVSLNGGASTDAEGAALTLAWTFLARPAGSSAALSDPVSVKPTFVADLAGEYRLQLIVNDGRVSSAPDFVVIKTTGQNTPPVADAGPDQAVFVGTQTNLNGTGSSDVDGDALTFAWTFVMRPAGSAAVLNDPASATPNFTPDLAGDYTFQLTVDDGHGATASDLVNVTTQVQNREPVASAGPDQAVTVGQAVNLDGSSSSDPDGNALNFVWSFTIRPAGSTATLANDTTATPSFTADRAGDFVVQLIVNDGQLASEPDTVLISTSNTPPVANAGADQAIDAGATVQLDGSASSDANNDDLSFLWSLTTRPAGSAAAISDPLIPAPTFVADRAGLYVAQLIVNDGTVDSAPDTASITAGNRPPAATNDTASTQAPTPVTIDVLINDSDPDGDTLTVSAVTQPANGSVANNGNNVVYTPNAGFEGTTTFTYTVSDGQGGTDTGTVTVTVNGAPPPVITIVATDPSASEVGADVGVFTLTRTGSTAQALNGIQLRISGTAENGSDYSSPNLPGAASGSVNFPAGQSSVTVTVTPIADALVEGNETIVLSIFDAADYDVGTPGSATVTISEPAAPVITITATDPNASEVGSEVGVFTLTRSGSTAQALNGIQLRISGTAENGSDYSSPNLPGAASGSVNFPAGQSSVAVTVTPTTDALVEGNETIVLAIFDAADYDVGTPGSATVTIADAGAPTPVITVAASDPNASEVGLDPGTFTLTRSGSNTADLVVTFDRVGTASGGFDYLTFNTAVIIPAGQSSVSITVSPFADAFVEGPETVTVILVDGANYDVGNPSSATVTIADVAAPVITVVASDPNASEVGLDPGTFTLTRSGSNAFDLVVTFDREGTASGGFDYLTFNTAVIFPAGQSSVTITVEPFADAFVEGPETVTVILADGAHYDVGTPSSATVTIADAAAPVITVIASDPNASEVGLDPGAFTLTRSGSNAFDLVVTFDRVGTASGGFDYLTFNTAVIFPAGQSSVTITVEPFADAFVEVPETVTVILTDGAHYDVGTPSSATVTIADSP